MKISLNWIKQFTDVPEKYSPKELSELLTLRTCEVEGYEDQRSSFASMVVGRIVKIRVHPGADKLKLVDTDIGGRVVQIVCGGQNVAEGMYVPVALPGAKVHWHGQEEVTELKETKIRGEESFGMICAGEEIGLPPAPPMGITDLSALWSHLGHKPSKPGTPLADALKMSDTILDVDNKSLTHRPDLWGHYGMAREFSAFLEKKLLPFEKVLKNFAGAKVFPSKGEKVKVDFEDKKAATRFLSTIISGIKIERSPEWLADVLKSCGMRPVNNIVDITNFVMLELGHPLHAFDRRVVNGDHFVIRRAKKGEHLETLDHKKRTLHEEDILVTDGKKILGLAGIMGGLESEVKSDTTEILLEVAAWNPIAIRKSSQRHSLRSDAAQRFEKSLDPEVAGLAFRRACQLITEICPGSKISAPLTDIYLEKPKKITVTVDTEKLRSKIGAPVDEKEMIRYLTALEFGVKKSGKNSIKVTVPSFRATKDINIEDDIVEEVARMYGYEKIKPTLPTLPTKLPSENTERILKHIAREILSLGLGFYETTHYSFYGKEQIEKSKLPEALHVKLLNPLTQDQTHMRISLLPNLLEGVARNLNIRDNLKLYEIGHTYIKRDQYFPLEEKFIAGVVTLPKVKEVFYEALGAAETFLERFGAQNIQKEVSTAIPPYAHPSKCGVMRVKGTEVATIYEIHPEVLKAYGINQPVAAFEINFTRLATLGTKEAGYKSLPRFPGIEIDVSVLMPKQTAVGEIMKMISKVDRELIVNVRAIDSFEDKSLGEDKKSITFRVLLQSPDRTLTDNEMRHVQEKISDAVKKTGFSVR